MTDSLTAGRRDGGRGKSSADDTGQQADNLLADELSDLARDLQQETSTADTLDAIVRAAVGTVPGAEWASISAVKRRREVHSLASTGELAAAVDRAQYETEEGPCLETLFTERTVRLTDMTTEDRWPRFTARAADLGVLSMLAVQLYVDGDELGALNLHAGTRDAFDDEAEHVALLFAAHASVALKGAEETEQLRLAVRTRDVIGQAKGIVMERHKVTGDRAFYLLAQASQNQNRKLADVAAELVRRGDLEGRSAENAADARPTG